MERVMLASMTDDEVLAAGREACRELRAVVERHGVASADGLRGAMADVGDGDVSGLMLAVGGVIYPAVVGYEEKSVAGEPELADVVAANVAATGGAWEPSELAVELSVHEGDGVTVAWSRDAVVRFVAAGRRWEWRFDQSSKYVASDFYRLRDEFAAEALPGRFVNVITGDTFHCDLYLPAATAEEVVRILLALPEASPWLGSCDYFAFARRRGDIMRERT